LFQKLLEEKGKCETELENYNKNEPKDMYLSDLTELKKKLKVK
jgi:hypothetical protein